MQRDARIDLVRGAGILMIALDHLAGAADRLLPGAFTVPFVTWSRIGWSSAAEFFVFFSGYLVGVVYLRTLDTRGPMLLQARALHRAWQIYAANVLTALAVLMLLYATPLGSRALLESAYFARLTQFGAQGWIDFLSLRQAPMFFEILQLYVVLLIAAPAFLLLARANAWAALAASGAVWLAVQLDPQLTVRHWTFNPFAWQFVFVLGMLCGTCRVLDRIERWAYRRTLLVTSAVFVAAALLVKIVDKSGIAQPLIGELRLPGVDKGTLGALRLVHFSLSVVLIMQLLPREVVHASWPMRAVARIGKHSLECFCMSTILVYVGCGALIAGDVVSTLNVLASGIALTVALCVFALVMDWLRRTPWRGETRSAASRTPRPLSREAVAESFGTQEG